MLGECQASLTASRPRHPQPHKALVAPAGITAFHCCVTPLSEPGTKDCVTPLCSSSPAQCIAPFDNEGHVGGRFVFGVNELEIRAVLRRGLRHGVVQRGIHLGGVFDQVCAAVAVAIGVCRRCAGLLALEPKLVNCQVCQALV